MPHTGGGAFGAARVGEPHCRGIRSSTSSLGKSIRAGQVHTDANWVWHPKVPMSETRHWQRLTGLRPSRGVPPDGRSARCRSPHSSLRALAGSRNGTLPRVPPCPESVTTRTISPSPQAGRRRDQRPRTELERLIETSERKTTRITVPRPTGRLLADATPCALCRDSIGKLLMADGKWHRPKRDRPLAVNVRAVSGNLVASHLMASRDEPGDESFISGSLRCGFFRSDRCCQFSRSDRGWP